MANFLSECSRQWSLSERLGDTGVVWIVDDRRLGSAVILASELLELDKTSLLASLAVVADAGRHLCMPLTGNGHTG